MIGITAHSEKIRKQAATFLCQHAPRDFGMVIEPIDGKQVNRTAVYAALGIACAIPFFLNEFL